MILPNSGNLINHCGMYWGQFKDSVCYLFLADAVISPARKRNLGQAYIFTSICHSVHWRSWLPSMHHRSYDQGRSAPRGVCIEGGLYRGGSASRGWGSTYRWMCLKGGLHPGGSALGGWTDLFKCNIFCRRIPRIQ